MIAFIKHNEEQEAIEIRRVFQASYKVEAALLGALNFPPLSRSLDEFYNCPNDFLGYYEDHELVAVVEMKNEVTNMLIQSLVVDPNYFRKGIARKLISFVLNHYDTIQFTVETGKDNEPARMLYEGFDFVLEKTYTADENIIKVGYRRNI